MTELTETTTRETGAEYRRLAEQLQRGEPVTGLDQSYVSRALLAYADLVDAQTLGYEVQVKPVEGRILCEVWDRERRPHPARRGSFYGSNVSVAIRGAIVAVMPARARPAPTVYDPPNGLPDRAQGPSPSPTNSLL